MDIFTTQLTRVVPVPIKPASLKVKALLKEAATSELTQDPDHLENHEYYFTNEKDEYHNLQHENSPKACRDDNATEVEDNNEKPEKLEEETNDKDKHLDLYA